MDCDFTLRNGTRVQLRSARPDDALPIIQFLNTAVWETDFSDFSPSELSLSEHTAQQYIRNGMEGDNHLLLLAIADEIVIGMLTFSGGKWSRNRHAGEMSMTVLRQHWGMGLGGAMVDYLLEWAQSGGIVKKIHLRVRTDNERAIALYEKKGFSREGLTSSDMLVDGRMCDHWHMGRAL